MLPELWRIAQPSASKKPLDQRACAYVILTMSAAKRKNPGTVGSIHPLNSFFQFPGFFHLPGVPPADEANTRYRARTKPAV